MWTIGGRSLLGWRGGTRQGVCVDSQLVPPLDVLIAVLKHSGNSIGSARFCSLPKGIHVQQTSPRPGLGGRRPPRPRRGTRDRASCPCRRTARQRGHGRDRPVLPAAGVRRVGDEPRLVRQHHGPLPGTHPPEARRHAVRRGRPPPQHRALQHRRWQRARRPQGLHEDRRDDGRLLEGPGGHHQGGHRLVEPRRPRALGLVRRPGAALVGGPGQEQGDQVGGLQ